MPARRSVLTRRLSLTVLGADGSYPAPGGACSGYLVRTATTSVWLDAGPGTLANLQRHVELAQVDAVVISHTHADHWSDLEGFSVALRYYLGRSGVPVYAPAGLAGLLRGGGAEAFEWHEVSDGSRAVIGDSEWRWSRTDHPVETLAACVSAGGRRLGYSADSGPGWELGRLGKGLDLALVEATTLAPSEGTMAHLSARQAAGMAANAAARRLVLTHLAPGVDPAAARAEAVAGFAGPVHVAAAGRTWAL